MKPILAVPTNIITGFLGTGKTSAILHLLKHKPANERWAVLVNEFGEIGVDGSLFEGQHSKEQGVFVSEVPGGCMCCTAGLPMQIGLNALLKKARPDRLLIEPTGLGHPIEVLNILSGENYKKSISLQQIITLVDARNLADIRYTQHETFNQQISIADVLLGNKADLYQEEDKARLHEYAKSKAAAHVKVLFTEQGVIDPFILNGQTQAQFTAEEPHFHKSNKPSLSDIPIPECGFVKAENKGEGFKSIGWRFSPQKVFDRQKLFAFFRTLQNVERMKAVFISQHGPLGYNLTKDGFTEMDLDETTESRIEIIAVETKPSWEAALLNCII